MKIEDNWKKEIARDLIALGSIPFYILVIGRSLVGSYFTFTFQLLISIIILYLVHIFFKDFNEHLARALVLVVFTIIFYNDLSYSLFAIVVFIILILSSFYLKIPKKEIGSGLLLGAISSFMAYILAPLI